jgi:hypothetical protein
LQGGSPWPPGVIPRGGLASVRSHSPAQILMIVSYEKRFSWSLHLVMVLLEEEIDVAERHGSVLGSSVLNLYVSVYVFTRSITLLLKSRMATSLSRYGDNLFWSAALLIVFLLGFTYNRRTSFLYA